jgi:excinuclease ABC subunit B
MQYERNEMDFKRGVYRVRGDVIDIFPAENAESAVRITLFDDEIESLTLFDPLTGHTRQKLGRFTVFPSSHYVTPRATVLQAIEAIKEELRERIEFFQANQKLVEASASSSAPASTSKCSTSWASARASRTTRGTCRGARPASRRRR